MQRTLACVDKHGRKVVPVTIGPVFGTFSNNVKHVPALHVGAHRCKYKCSKVSICVSMEYDGRAGCMA